MTREGLADKFHDCAQGVLSYSTEQRVLDTIYGLESLADVKTLTTLLRG